METTFSDSNIAPDIGVELAFASGVNALDLQTPEISSKFNEVVKYFNKFQDAAAIARMVSRGTQTKDKLSKIYEYVGLRKELDSIRESLKKLPSSDTVTGDTEKNRKLRSELQSKEIGLLNEIQRYE